MRRLATILCGFAIAFAFCCREAQAEKRVALVIGNSNYATAGNLTNPVNDANAMAELFRKSGFEVVESRLDLGNLEFKRMVRQFTTTARDADIAVLYFAGHGIEVNGINYLIPVDAKLASDFDVEDEALSLDRLLRALEPVKRLRLVILDACRDNPFVRNMQRQVASRAAPTSGLAKVEPGQSDTLVAFAARANSTADDGAGTNSPFTAALLNHLAVPGRDVRIALGFVRDEVLRATRNKQEPFVYGSLGGATVALVPEKEKVAAPQPVVPVVPPTSGADPRRDYEFAERVATREAWDSFLSLHPSGFYSDLARAQRDKLALRVEPKAAPAVEAKPELKSEAKAPSAIPPVPAIAQEHAAEKPAAKNIAVLPAPGSDKPAAPPAAAPAAEQKPANIAVLPPPASAAPPPVAAAPAAEQKPANVAVLPPPAAPSAPAESKPDRGVNIAVVTRDLQTELRRVGCDAGRVDGNWSAKWREALSDFNKRAGTEFEIKVASVDALDGVKAQRGRICPLICGKNQHVEGDQCVANPVEKKPARQEASRPPEPSPRERARERAKERAQQERVRERRQASRPARASCPAGQTPFNSGGRMCCELTPDGRGAPRIICP